MKASIYDIFFKVKSDECSHMKAKMVPLTLCRHNNSVCEKKIRQIVFVLVDG